MFRVKLVDNYARETVSDVHVVYMRSEERAKQVTDLINADAGPDPSRWCTVCPADQPLYKFEP